VLARDGALEENGRHRTKRNDIVRVLVAADQITTVVDQPPVGVQTMSGLDYARPGHDIGNA
jgi:hypothetical protein